MTARSPRRLPTRPDAIRCLDPLALRRPGGRPLARGTGSDALNPALFGRLTGQDPAALFDARQ